MWTFTFAELLDIKDTRKRWNHLLTLLKVRWPKLCGLRVFEMHKSHGLHVHLVTNQWIDVNAARVLAAQAGWGRIHVMQMPVERAAYLGKYLSKERPPCLKRWRLWAGFGDWDWTRVKDVVFESRFCTIYRACKDWLHWKGNKGFFDRLRIVSMQEIRSAEEGWTDGLGPGDKPFWMCSWDELMVKGTVPCPV
ncbi:MAG: hypothetical protein ABIT76_00135 [Chthoniobacterales bacterium]